MLTLLYAEILKKRLLFWEVVHFIKTKSVRFRDSKKLSRAGLSVGIHFLPKEPDELDARSLGKPGVSINNEASFV
jgi:hypothetical protein